MRATQGSTPQLFRKTYAYDGNGNPTTYKGTTLTYDVENRLTAHGSAMTAGYNGDGLRAWKTAGGTTTYYLYDGYSLLCELNAAGTVTATNTWGANGLVSRRVGSTSTFYVYDPQGSVAQRLDGSGNVQSSDLYDAYGNRISGSTTDPVCYNGQWGYYMDSETGLVLCTYRYYDPANGRWVTRDPIGYAGGVNVYGYVADNPASISDPSGLKSRYECCVDAASQAYANKIQDCAKQYRKCMGGFFGRLNLFRYYRCGGQLAACQTRARADYQTNLQNCMDKY